MSPERPTITQVTVNQKRVPNLWVLSTVECLHMYATCCLSVIQLASLISALFMPKNAAKNPRGSYKPTQRLSAHNTRTDVLVRTFLSTHEENCDDCKCHDRSAL